MDMPEIGEGLYDDEGNREGDNARSNEIEEEKELLRCQEAFYSLMGPSVAEEIYTRLSSLSKASSGRIGGARRGKKKQGNSKKLDGKGKEKEKEKKKEKNRILVAKGTFIPIGSDLEQNENENNDEEENENEMDRIEEEEVMLVMSKSAADAQGEI